MLGFLYAVILTLLIFFTIYLQGWSFRKPMILKIDFPETVEGLRNGDDVKVDGVMMGKVAEVRLRPGRGVQVTVRLDEPIEVYPGYDVSVGALSILGGNEVSIRRGTQAPGVKPIDTEQVPLEGKAKPSAFDQLGELVATRSISGRAPRS